jgi:CheY-like chemotaxis protein
MEKPKLLLFDDEEKTADLTIDALDDDFDVVWKSNQDELDEVITDNFSVIVTDVSIKDSEKTGFQIIDDLRRKYRITRTPIVVYSAKVNIYEIENEQGNLFYRYIDKVGKESNDELLSACKDAIQLKRNFVSFETLECYFDKCKILDEEIDPADLGRLTPFIETSALQTNRQLLGQLKKQDLEEDLWNVLEDLAWDIHQRVCQNNQ